MSELISNVPVTSGSSQPQNHFDVLTLEETAIAPVPAVAGVAVASVMVPAGLGLCGTVVLCPLGVVIAAAGGAVAVGGVTVSAIVG